MARPQYSFFCGYSQAYVYIRAFQGHSKSTDPVAALQRINEINMPNLAVHGTSIPAARKIVQEGMIPGGGATQESRSRQANHFAVTLPNDTSHVISGYRSEAPVCIFFDLAYWVESGFAAYLSPNEVVCVFEHIPVEYIIAAVRVADGYCFKAKAIAPKRLIDKLQFMELGDELGADRRLPLTTAHVTLTRNMGCCQWQSSVCSKLISQLHKLKLINKSFRSNGSCLETIAIGNTDCSNDVFHRNTS